MKANKISLNFRLCFACLLVGIAISWILGTFFYRSWMPADDGCYAHVAERLLKGEVLNRDITEYHPGEVHFINALTFRLLGYKMVYLRYPILLITWIQCWLFFLLFLKKDLKSAMLAALVPACLGFVEASNSILPHFSSLFVTVLLICLLQWTPPETKWRTIVVGFLISTMFLLRQLTGLFVGIGVFSYLLLESEKTNVRREFLWERVLLLLMSGILVLYTLTTTNLIGAVLFGIWPVVLLVDGFFMVKSSNKATSKILALFCLGAAAGFLPIIFYHVAHHTLNLWFYDFFIHPVFLLKAKYLNALFANSLSGGNYSGQLSAHTGITYADYFLVIGYGFLSKPGFFQVLNGIYWVLLLLLALLNGFYFYVYWRSRRKKGLLVAPLPYMTVFYGLVSVFNQIPAYLYLSVGLSLVSILWLAKEKDEKTFKGWFWIAVFLCAVGVCFHTGQSALKVFSDKMKGVQVPVAPCTNLKRCGLWIDPVEAQIYSRLTELIQKETSPEEPIFAMPYDAQIYFLSDRRNVVRYIDIPMNLQNKQALSLAMKEIADKKPALVIYDFRSSHRSLLDGFLLRYVRKHYRLLEQIGDFVVYRYSSEKVL